MVSSLFETYDLPLPDFLARAADEAVIQLQWVAAVRHGDSGFIVFKTPDRMNALSEAVMGQLAGGFKMLDSDPRVKRIFFVGEGKAFVAGADIRFFLDALDQDDIPRIVDFTRRGQALFSRISESHKPTVAYLDGLALGGGLELALACRHRWGTTRSRLGFPETGIGIYPGLGGTQRLPRLVGRGLAKRLIASGEMLDAPQALECGLLDCIVERVSHWRQLADMEVPDAPADRQPPRDDALFADFDGVLDEGWLQTDAFEPYRKVLLRKAPQALRQAMVLVDRGAGLPLPQALELEMQGLPGIFASDDARIGLESVLARKAPKFGAGDAS